MRLSGITLVDVSEKKNGGKQREEEKRRRDGQESALARENKARDIEREIL